MLRSYQYNIAREITSTFSTLKILFRQFLYEDQLNFLKGNHRKSPQDKHTNSSTNSILNKALLRKIHIELETADMIKLL